MGSSCSRVGRQESSNHCDDSSSSRSFSQVSYMKFTLPNGIRLFQDLYAVLPSNVTVTEMIFLRHGFSVDLDAKLSYLHQAFENSETSADYYRENVVTIDNEGSSNFDLQSAFTCSNAQTDVSYESSNDELSNISNENGERNTETHNQFALPESQQLHTYPRSLGLSQVGNLDNTSVTAGDTDQSTDGSTISSSLQGINSSNSVHDLESLSTDRQSGLHTEDNGHNNSDVASRSLGSGSRSSPMTLYLLGFDSSRETTSQGMLDILPRAEQELESGLHIDMVSISSSSVARNIQEMGTRELRSRGRRSFWDAITRQNLTRHRDIPAILLAIDDADDVAVNSSRLTHDANSDSRQNDNATYDWGTRSNSRTGQRQSRFERADGVHPGSILEDRHRSLCASGLHRHGSCSCASQLPGDDIGALVRISRIVIIVEAINELLDELHRHTMPFSAPTLSLPAPESIVNALPLKNHKKLDMSSEEAQQCYICLAEYEEDDKIRVLPCKHEYHMPCVDKWLKEVHGICPLCRADVSTSSQPQSTEA